MYPTRTSARIQQEKEIELNNQLLTFFNDFLKVTCKLSIINEDIINEDASRRDELGTNTVDIKDKDLDKLLSSNKKKKLLDTMNNIYKSLRAMCYSSVEEQIRREEEMRRKKVEDKLNKKIEGLKKELLTLKQSVIAEKVDKSIDTSQFKKELVQLSLLYKDERDIEENTDIFDNVEYHNSFISEIYHNSGKKIKENLTSDRKSLSMAFEGIDKEIQLINRILKEFLTRIETYQNRMNTMESVIKRLIPESDLNTRSELENSSYSPMTLLKILDQIRKIDSFVEKNKENIDSIPIIQKYTYKNEQDINDVKKKIDNTMNPLPVVSNPIVIPDDYHNFSNNNYNSGNNNFNNPTNYNSNTYNNGGGYMANKRQKTNENDYINKNNYRSGPNDLVPINSDQRTLNANTNGMFNRGRHNKNNLPPPLSINGNINYNYPPPPDTLTPSNSAIIAMENRINDLDKRLNFNFQILGDQIYDKHTQGIVEKFNEICAQMNTMHLKNVKNLTDDVENRLKAFQDEVNQSNLQYINDHIKAYNKSIIDTMEQSFKTITLQVNIWKRKMAEDLQVQFGHTIQELKLQILSLSKLPIPKDSGDYINLIEFLKDVFRWNWEKWKIEWTKEFYQCVKLLKQEYFQQPSSTTTTLENQSKH
ncbi:hypothetical protein BCR36DRAFT_405630 [Piromyces finnis]|uniref:Uncharacterized protein n=1 Tax=Piromyces finnis TaxID=1754191 RepID=A0A1Y1V4W0_9FUNG|nr:hypothetical protein BCR36DRAFT_405630 [Piromyces finnis]|eukprot:ORX46687.1 hypothetical protein BCR36DRAFT_405630 [Piromyces finnis]